MTWHGLYIRSEDSNTVADSLGSALEVLGYKSYDPFPGGSGTPPELKTFIKHFVAPAQDGWVKVLGEPDENALERISREFPLLHAWLSDTDGDIVAYINGSHDEKGLANYVSPNKTIDHLRKARDGSLPVIVEKSGGSNLKVIGLPLVDLGQLVSDNNVKPDQASNMISKLTSQLFGKLDKSSGGEATRMQEEARSMLNKAHGVDWNSSAGQRLRAIASVLTLPSNWRDPDFDTVRDAYQVARRLKRNPNAHLMPDEREALKALPDAIQYQPVYVGK